MCFLTWTVVLSTGAERALARMQARDRRRIAQALLDMERDPVTGDVSPLKGPYWGSFRRRIGSWRIIFLLRPENATVAIADILRRTSTTY